MIDTDAKGQKGLKSVINRKYFYLTEIESINYLIIRFRNLIIRIKKVVKNCKLIMLSEVVF